MLGFLKNLFVKRAQINVENRYRRREREVDIICNDIREKYPDVSRAVVEEIMDMTLSFVEREVDIEQD